MNGYIFGLAKGTEATTCGTNATKALAARPSGPAKAAARAAEPQTALMMAWKTL